MSKAVPINILSWEDESIDVTFPGESVVRPYNPGGTVMVEIQTNKEGFKHLLNLQTKWEAERYGNKGHD